MDNHIGGQAAGYVVLNVFTVKPENQEPLIDCIRGSGEPTVLPGLLSMNLLRSLDGTQVINHMVWESAEAFEQATANSPEIAATMRRVSELIEDARPGTYELVPMLTAN